MRVSAKLVTFGLFFLMSLDAVATTPTPNLLRNLDIQRYYQAALRGGEVLELSSNSERFIGLYLEQGIEEPQGGVLILHDVGHTPDWPVLLQATRKYLPDVGWSTLSIDLPTPQHDAIGQLPLTEGDASTADTGTLEDWESRILERIATGIGHLNDQGIFNIAILGYGDGAYWGARYLAERLSEDEEEGYALILFEPALNYADLPDQLARLIIPVLDITMKNSDYAMRQAKTRLAAVRRAKHPDYLQIHDAARQGFYNAPTIDRSTRRIWGWLRNHAAGYEANLKEKPP